MAITRLFQRAFKKIVDLECTPSTLLGVAREQPELYQAVLEEHARMVAAGELEPEGRSPEEEVHHLIEGIREANPDANADTILRQVEEYIVDHTTFDVEWLGYWVLAVIETHLRATLEITDQEP